MKTQITTTATNNNNNNNDSAPIIVFLPQDYDEKATTTTDTEETTSTMQQQKQEQVPLLQNGYYDDEEANLYSKSFPQRTSDAVEAAAKEFVTVAEDTIQLGTITAACGSLLGSLCGHMFPFAISNIIHIRDSQLAMMGTSSVVTFSILMLGWYFLRGAVHLSGLGQPKTKKQQETDDNDDFESEDLIELSLSMLITYVTSSLLSMWIILLI